MPATCRWCSQADRDGTQPAVGGHGSGGGASQLAPRSSDLGRCRCELGFRLRVITTFKVSQLAWLQPSPHAAPALQAAPPDSDAAAGQERRFVRSLLLAWFASQNRSLFAARCLVEVVIEMYQEGVTVDDVAVRCTVV